ncbi:hypothetical protein Tco_1469890, partial [Tanacetum coccineum]
GAKLHFTDVAPLLEFGTKSLAPRLPVLLELNGLDCGGGGVPGDGTVVEVMERWCWRWDDGGGDGTVVEVMAVSCLPQTMYRVK